MGYKKLRQESAVEAVKAAPAVVGTTYSMLTLNEWVAVATLLYIVLQVGVLVHKHYHFVKDKRKEITLADVKEKVNELSD